MINILLFGVIFFLYKEKAKDLEQKNITIIVRSLTSQLEATIRALASQTDFFNLLISNKFYFEGVPQYKKYSLMRAFSSNIFESYDNSAIGYRISNNSFNLFDVGKSSKYYISYRLNYRDDIYDIRETSSNLGNIIIFFDKDKLIQYLNSKNLILSSTKYGKLLQQEIQNKSSNLIKKVSFPNIYIRNYDGFVGWRLIILFLLSFMFNILFLFYISWRVVKYYEHYYVNPVLEIYDSLSKKGIVKRQKYYVREIQRLINIINKAKKLSRLDTLSQIQHDLKPAFIQLQKLASEIEDHKKKYIISISEYIRMAVLNKSNEIRSENLSCIIAQLVNSTYFSYKEIFVVDYSRYCFSKVDKIVFSRIISNLVNNAIEVNKGRIDLKIKLLTKVSFGNVYVTVEDNGVGVGKDRLEEIFDKGRSFNYSSGIGLFFCREAVREYGGDISCNSDSESTRFTIKLPVSAPEYNYIDSIYINDKSRIVIIDDEQPSYFRHIEGIDQYDLYLNSCKSVEEYFSSVSIDKTDDIYLIDYNFSSTMTGVDIIEKYNLIGKAYVITTVADNLRQRTSEKLKELIPILDKSIANVIQIKNVRFFDYFILEDDVLICKIMKDKAKLNKQRILIANNFLQFNMIKEVLYKSDRVVLDINIKGSSIKGDHYVKELKKQGFLNISVQTGHSNLNLGEGVRIIEKGSF
ncbi:sensor histidine kinase [Francisella salimarina]|uniref:sensor histidine kinase n=2 Tax=Francisellaceae TaxID=34064 RepID=UPI0015D01C4F|nr:HAMP domain-containing sensor histidine kinase [Francisella salimarina]